MVGKQKAYLNLTVLSSSEECTKFVILLSKEQSITYIG